MKRKENESFIAYKKRRNIENNIIKERQKGRMVWCSAIINPDYRVKEKAQGTYRRSIHGELV
jgi:hypothetical protein